MEDKTWVLVADGNVGHLYLSFKNGPLELVENIDGHNDAPVPAKKDEMTVFAKRVGQRLDQAFDAGEYKKLYIIASPAFLGLLREDLSARVKAVIAEEIAKDLVSQKPEQIRTHLPLVL